jgi:spermidine/putrescine transport system substrate-binding protein
MAKPHPTDRPLPDPRSTASTRREFLGRGALVLGGVALGPTLLAACGSSSKTATGSTAGTAGQGAKDLRFSNWPAYIGTDPDTIAAFKKDTGISVSYREDVNDNEEWFAKNKDPLSHHADIGADLVVLTDFMVARLMSLGWLAKLDSSQIPNKKNLRQQLMDVPYDNGRSYSLPWMSGMTGLAYNSQLVHKPVTSVDDLFDPAYKGKVTMLSDLRDGLGMVMLSQGNTPANPSTATVQKAADKVQAIKNTGQIRRFTGNDYLDDLAQGNVIVAQVYSGDVAQLQKDNPHLQFVVPKDGSTMFSDNMVIPYTAKNQVAAQTFMNWVYDPKNYAPLVGQVQYIPVISNVAPDLAKFDSKLVTNPLINPPASTLSKLTTWKALTDKEDQEYTSIYASVTGG